MAIPAGAGSSWCRALSFAHRPSFFASEEATVVFVMALVTGKALTWVTAVWESQSPNCRNADLFCEEIKKVFDHVVSSYQAASSFFQLWLGPRSVADFAIEFWSLAAESKWTPEALVPAFHHGLSEQLKDEMAAREDIQDLDSIIFLAIRVNNCLRERRRQRREALANAPEKLP